MFAPRGWLQGRGNQAVYRSLSQSPLFDKNWYRNAYLTGIEKLTDPLWHFIRKGWQQGWDPSPRFDTSFYLWWNKDVRESQVNPLDHFLNYGEAEGRPALTPLAQWWPDEIAALNPAKFYVAPSTGMKRITIVIDTNTPHRWKGDVALGILLSAWLAHSLSRELRILVRDSSPAIPHINSDFFHWPNSVPPPQVTRIPAGIEYSDIARYPDEIFVATSWSSAHSLHSSLGGSQLIYLVSRDEPAVLGAGAAREAARTALHLEGVSYVVTSHCDPALLWGERKASNMVFHDENLNLGYFVKKDPEKGGPDQPIVVWSGENPSTSQVRTVLSSLELALAGEAFNVANHPILLAGDSAQRLLLLGTHAVGATEPQSVDEEIALIRSAAVVVALDSTDSGHPVADSARELGVTAVSDSDVANPVTDIGELVASALGEKTKGTKDPSKRPAGVLGLAERLGKHCA
jgi:hypothetical protein